jgi:ribosomal protein S17
MKLSLIIVVITLIFSCNSRKKEPDKIADYQLKEKRIENKIGEISKKNNNASAKIDTQEFIYSYQYQKAIKENPYVIIHDFEISDIKIKDSSFLLTIYKNKYNKKMLLELDASEEQILSLTKNFNGRRRIDYEETYIVAKITTVNKARVKLGFSLGYDYDEEYDYGSNTIESDFEEAELFILKGKLINVIISENK